MSMTTQDLNRLETSIATAKDAASKAQGAIEQLDQDALAQYGMHSPEETEAEIEKLQTQIQALDRRAEVEEDVLRSRAAAAGISL